MVVAFTTHGVCMPKSRPVREVPTRLWMHWCFPLAGDMSLCWPFRDQIEGQLKRLGVDAIDLWVLRGFKEDETPVEETMAAVKVTVAQLRSHNDL